MNAQERARVLMALLVWSIMTECEVAEVLHRIFCQPGYPLERMVRLRPKGK